MEAVHVQVTPRRSRSASSRVFVILSRLIVGVALVLLLVAIGLFGFRTLYDDRIYPAVVVGDVNVGGLTAAEAEARLTDRAAALETGTIAFTYGDQSWTPTLGELGVTVALGPSIAEAQALGRGDDAAARLAFTGEIPARRPGGAVADGGRQPGVERVVRRGRPGHREPGDRCPDRGRGDDGVGGGG